MTTALNHAEIERVGAQHGLLVADYQRLAAGTENTTYTVSGTTGTFVLTVLEKKEPAAAARYAAFLQALAQAGLAVAQPLLPIGDAPIVQVRGRPVLVTRFVPGRTESVFPAGRLAQAGAALAHLHTSELVCPFEPYIRIDDAAAAQIESLPDTAFGHWLLSWHEKVRAAVEAARQSTVPIHGDLFPDNIIITAAGEITLIDWEDCAQDSPAVDVGMALLGLCAPGRFSSARARDLLAGYHAAGAAPIDSELLFLTTIYVALFTGYQRYLKRQRGVAAAPYQQIRPFVESLEAAWPP